MQSVCHVEQGAGIWSSTRQPLVLPISWHTMIFGPPHRLRALRDGLKRILAHPIFERVWLSRPGEIAAYCGGLSVGTIPSV